MKKPIILSIILLLLNLSSLVSAKEGLGVKIGNIERGFQIVNVRSRGRAPSRREALKVAKRNAAVKGLGAVVSLEQVPDKRKTIIKTMEDLNYKIISERIEKGASVVVILARVKVPLVLIKHYPVKAGKEAKLDAGMRIPEKEVEKVTGEEEKIAPEAKGSVSEYIPPEISLPPYTGEKSYIAVLNLEAKGDTRKEIATVLSESLRNALVETKRFHVVERANMDAILQEQGLSLQDCTNSECIVKVGELLSAEKIVAGSIGRLGQTYSVEIQLTNVETGQIEKTATERCQCVEDDLFKVIDYVAKKLVVK